MRLFPRSTSQANLFTTAKLSPHSSFKSWVLLFVTLDVVKSSSAVYGNFVASILLDQIAPVFTGVSVSLLVVVAVAFVLVEVANVIGCPVPNDNAYR